MTAEKIQQGTTWQAVGGDTRILGDPGKWSPTVGPADNWDVIAREEARPLIDLLDSDLKGKVRESLERSPRRNMGWSGPLQLSAASILWPERIDRLLHRDPHRPPVRLGCL